MSPSATYTQYLPGYHNDHLVLLAVTSSTNDAFYHSSPNLILNRLLLVAGRSDEELVFDVDKVLRVFDNLNVCVLDRVLQPLAEATIHKCVLTSVIML